MKTRNVFLFVARWVVMGWALLGLSSTSFGHGLIMDPPARNWFCGAITKPDQVANGVAQYPVCGDAFNAPGIGLQFHERAYAYDGA
jgi:predicted carbohydrate-binding protein with CBM5 and CBM33 domain